MKEKIEEKIPLYTLNLEGEAPSLQFIISRLQLGIQACDTKGGDDPRLCIDPDFSYCYDDPPELDELKFSVVFKREETDDEYRSRLAKERRQRATDAAFTERKRARDILKLKEDAERLGFCIAYKAPEK